MIVGEENQTEVEETGQSSGMAEYELIDEAETCKNFNHCKHMQCNSIKNV